MSKPAPDRRPFTQLEHNRALALGRVRFGGGASFSRRFARDMSSLARSDPSKGITDKQAAQLERICWIYRRQLPRSVVPGEKPTDTRSGPSSHERAEMARLEAYLAEVHAAPGDPQLQLSLTR